MNDHGPEAYRCLDRFEGRKRIVADLEELGLMDEIKPHKLMAPRGDRSHAIVEPFLTDQWYVKTAPLAGPAIAAVKTGKIKFIPENWEKTYFDWMNPVSYTHLDVYKRQIPGQTCRSCCRAAPAAPTRVISAMCW